MEMTSLNKDGKMICCLSGEIDHHSSRTIRDGIDRLIAQNRPKVLVLDLENIAFMDSSGLGLVLGRYRKMRESGGEMFLCNTSERTLKFLKMAGVDKIIRSIDDKSFDRGNSGGSTDENLQGNSFEG